MLGDVFRPTSPDYSAPSRIIGYPALTQRTEKPRQALSQDVQERIRIALIRALVKSDGNIITAYNEVIGRFNVQEDDVSDAYVGMMVRDEWNLGPRFETVLAPGVAEAVKGIRIATRTVKQKP